MRVLVLGSGGRESALAWKISQSPLVAEVIVAPGNGGMKELSEKISLYQGNDYVSLGPDLVVVGPEAFLAEGIVDFFEAQNIPCVGPSQKASRLESSKDFCKEILMAGDIPTSKYVTVGTVEDGLRAIDRWEHEQMVIKVDELAAGKGVIVASDKKEARAALSNFFNGSFLGVKAKRIVIEDTVYGNEVSAFALCDGENFIYLGSATDYKRLNDNDKGPNTGGMGTVSPAPVLTSQDEEWIKKHVFAPLLNVMMLRNQPFKGFLFAGLMKTSNGFSVLEFNVRLGDPETQSLIPRINEDIVPLLLAAAKGELKKITYTEPSRNVHALHVVMTAKGYPGINGEEVRKGDLISKTSLDTGAIYFPAAVKSDEHGTYSNGGRVCGVTAIGSSLKEVRTKAYTELNKVSFKDAHFRKDIGERYL